MKGLVVSEIVFAVAGPPQAKANEAHGVTAKETFLFVVNPQGAIGKNGSRAIGRTTRTDGLGSCEGHPFVGREGNGYILAGGIVRTGLEDNIPRVSIEFRTPVHIFAVAGITVDACCEACLWGLLPSHAIIRRYIIIIIAAGANANGQVTVVSLQDLRLVSCRCTALSAYIPGKAAILGHKAVVVLRDIIIAPVG